MQNVNLYVAELRPRRVILPARQLLLAWLLVLLAIMALQALLQWRAAQAEAALRQAQQGFQSTQRALESVEARLAQYAPDEGLRAEIQRLSRHLQATRALQGALRPDDGRATAQTFVGLLEGLSRQRLDGLWLTGINLLDEGREVQLRGRMIQPELLPIYLQRLQSEPAFSGRSFNVMNLQASDAPESRDLEFFIGTHEIIEPAKALGILP